MILRVLAALALTAIFVVPAARGTVTDVGEVSITPAGVLEVGALGLGTRTIDGMKDGPYAGATLGPEFPAIGLIEILNGGKLTVSGPLVVGDRGEGEVTVEGGSKLVSDSAAVADRTLSGFGTVRVAGEGSRWVNAGDLVVYGDQAVEAGGAVEVDDGGRILTAAATMPQASIGGGRIQIEGEGSRWENHGTLSILHQRGVFILRGGAHAQDNEVFIRPRSFGVQAVVEGHGTKWQTGPLTFVSGTLDILDGARVKSESASVRSSRRTLITVDGDATSWSIDGLFDLGGNDAGGADEIRVTGGAAVSNGPASIAFGGADRGTVIVDGPGSKWLSEGDVTVGAGALDQARGTVTIVSAARATSHGVSLNCNIRPRECRADVLGVGSKWSIDGAVFVGGDASGPGAHGTIGVSDEGSMTATGTIDVYPGGLVELDRGGLKAPLVFVDGVLAGCGSLRGHVTNRGAVVVGASHGVLKVVGGYLQDSTGLLEIEIGGTIPGQDHDVLVVKGKAFVDGVLEVLIDPAFSPRVGDRFKIIRTDFLRGTFAEIRGLDTGGGAVLVPDYSQTGLTLKAELGE